MDTTKLPARGCFGPARPRFGPARPRFGPARPRFGPARPRFGHARLLLGLACLLLGPARPRFGPARPRFGPACLLLGLACLLLGPTTAAGAPDRPGAQARPSTREATESPATATATPPGAMGAIGAMGASGEAERPRPANGAGEHDEPPPDAVAAPPEEAFYRRIALEACGPLWLEPGQRGLIEAHPLVMGLAAMALATVVLLFFFLRGVKRPKDEDR